MSDRYSPAGSSEGKLLDPGWVAALQDTIGEWFAQNGRDFPWRNTADTYHVLIAEVLLRRTQAERVVGPYLELIARYPTVRYMADADISHLREWFRPLGLVSRANQLVGSACAILGQYGGTMPRELSQLMRLPGLGRYSARAIACLGFGDAVPMIDESSGRLLRRLLGLRSRRPAFSDRGLLLEVARLVPRCNSAAFNLGVLDIAALYCRPDTPECARCPLLRLCAYGWAATTRMEAVQTDA